MEATTDYHERTRLNMFTQVFMFIVLVSIQWAFPFTRSKIFTNPIAGVRCFAILFGSFMAIVGMLPFFLTKEILYSTSKVQERRPLLANLKATLRNKPFLLVLGARTISTASYNIVAVLGLYLNYYYVFRGDVNKAAIMQGWNGTIFQLAGIASLFLYRGLAIRYGKRNAIITAAVVLAAGSISKLFVYIPGKPWLQVIVYVTNGSSAAGLGMLADAMLPDIADYDESRSGIRREGMYASVLVWFDRIGYSIGTLISGFILVWIGFDVKLGGAQPLYTLQLLKILYFIFPFIGSCAVIYLMTRYTLNEKLCYEIKQHLETRRNALLNKLASNSFL